jgi:hypothetical protein
MYLWGCAGQRTAIDDSDEALQPVNLQVLKSHAANPFIRLSNGMPLNYAFFFIQPQEHSAAMSAPPPSIG